MSNVFSNRYPMSETQLGFYYAWLRNPDSTEYNVPYLYKFSKNIDADKLEDSFRKALALHPIYSVKILHEDGDIFIAPEKDRWFDIERLTASEDQLNDIYKAFVRPFDLRNEQLIHASIIETEESVVLLFDTFHMVSDGNTLVMFFKDLDKIYRGIAPDPEKASYFEYILAEKESFKTDAYNNAKQHYKDLFDGVSMSKTLLQLPGDVGEACSVSSFVPAEVVDNFCKTYSATTNLLMMAAYSYVLSMFSREKKVAFYTVNHGRTERRFRTSFGPFIKSAPICIDLSQDISVIDFILSMKREMMGIIRHGVYPFSHFCQDLGIIPETSFLFQLGMEEKTEVGGEKIRVYPLPVTKVTNNMNMVVFENLGQYELRLGYNDAKHTKYEMQQFADCMRDTIYAMIGNPTSMLSDLLWSNQSIRNELLVLSDGEKVLPPEGTFLDMFRDSVRRFPDKTAVFDAYGSLTYQELDRRSTILAKRLIRDGVEVNDFVAIRLKRTKEWMIAIIAVFKAGAAYLPLSGEYPEERFNFIIEDSNARVVITESDMAFDDDTEDVELPAIDLDCNAYMIYTSGSTGKPKGVVIQHRAHALFVQTMSNLYQLDENSRVICHSSFGFDCSVDNVFPVLSRGGELHILSEIVVKEPALIDEYIEKNGITGAFFTTRFGVEMMKHYELPVKHITLGGERLDCVPKTNARFFNGYGPTEFTVFSVLAELNPQKQYDSIPIGRPLPNLRAYVLDDRLRLLPRGCVGELYLAGPQIARGYWNRPELTAERFIKNPFSDEKDYNLMYRTGDLVWWNEDGELVYTDRVDRQVKLSGFRIEIGEIETSLTQCEGITQAVVDIKDVNGRQALCAYYTAKEELDAKALKSELRHRLPEYMIPSYFIHLREFPYNHSNKVDMKKLPMPVANDVSDYQAPATVDEQVMCSIVERVMQMPQVGVNSDLLNLGMTSMQAMKIAVEAESMGINLSVASMYENHNIRGFLKNPQRLYFWANDYDENKPLMILFCGYMYYHPFYDEFVETFKDKYSIFVMENFVEFFLWKRKVDFEGLMDLFEEITRTVLADKEIFCVTGHCMGSELAMHYAQRLIDKGLGNPRLLMVEGAVERPLQEVGEMDKSDVLAEHNRIKSLMINTRPKIHFSGDIIICMASEVTRCLEYGQPEETDENILSKAYDEYIDNRDKWKEQYPAAPYYFINANHWTIFSGDALKRICDITDENWLTAME